MQSRNCIISWKNVKYKTLPLSTVVQIRSYGSSSQNTVHTLAVSGKRLLKVLRYSCGELTFMEIEACINSRSLAVVSKSGTQLMEKMVN